MSEWAECVNLLSTRLTENDNKIVRPKKYWIIKKNIAKNRQSVWKKSVKKKKTRPRLRHTYIHSSAHLFGFDSLWFDWEEKFTIITNLVNESAAAIESSKRSVDFIWFNHFFYLLIVLFSISPVCVCERVSVEWERKREATVQWKEDKRKTSKRQLSSKTWQIEAMIIIPGKNLILKHIS